MTEGAKMRKLSLGRKAVFNQVRQMAEEMNCEQFFDQLETMIDQVRRDLELVPDPEFREQLREVFREVIDYALSLKLEDAFIDKAAQG